MKKKKIILAITGASGSIYAKQLIDKLKSKALKDQIDDVALVFSKNALDVWNHELGKVKPKELPFRTYALNDYNAPFASGSAKYDTMIICPCSMGTLGRIAHGISDDLIGRAADVILKERRKLILVPRENPLNLIHINNFKTVMEAGAIISPAIPSFYSKPTTINELVGTVISRILDLAGFEIDAFRWQGSKNRDR
ncbi:MAG: UbiX family flavin prenyltransferase [Chloroflexia bacterium]|nr:UbiX family flavin prenyltransferase [Chloroflexia bacterium]